MTARIVVEFVEQKFSEGPAIHVHTFRQEEEPVTEAELKSAMILMEALANVWASKVKNARDGVILVRGEGEELLTTVTGDRTTRGFVQEAHESVKRRRRETR